MHETIEEILEMPGNVDAVLEGAELMMKGPKGEVKRRFACPIIVKEKKIILSEQNATKNSKKIIMTSLAHIKNMVKGVLEGYTYTLQICFVHFPMTVKVEKGELLIKNFLGESRDRKAKILPDVDVKVQAELIKVSSVDKEAAGQTAANIERATRITKRDRRIFQDGIWIIETPDKRFIE